MNLYQLFDWLNKQGIKLSAQDGKLHLRAPKGVLSPEIQKILSERKAEILEFMTQNHQKIEKFIDLSAEAVLESTIYPENTATSLVTEPTSIFLTGATGFLGAFLLSELLQQTQAKIYCLVRASELETAQGRLQNNLKFYNLWNSSFQSRIIPVLGDISLPQLGLTTATFSKLANEIDSIYHSGALLSYVYSYARLKPCNVLGTQEILRLACQSKTKSLHYISSFAVFESSAYCQKIVDENESLSDWEDIYLGYSQSKWVAEKLVMEARDRGLPINIYRSAFISGDSQTGIWKNNDIICRMIKGYIQMGSMPQLDYFLDLSPVDYVAQGIVYLSRQKQAIGKCYHLNNPHPYHWQDLFAWLCSLGYSIQLIPYQQWQKQLSATMRTNQNVLTSLIPFFCKQWGREEITIPELYQQNIRPKISCQETLNTLRETAIICPPVDTALLKIYFSYFLISGYLEPAS
ncbi:thioester reductase domain-containing protein [Nostoc sp. DedQUE07]|uniref:thioester reductase domain-containing protein n=1 Tax=Nostoc sp. DedQUE07 TaxID=3075392 RepID=UPI002AD390F8|nr:thioester reductase domain-containing protein [Nostoc sp. DedQUE07]MDZ8133531.1 thioester reductase domain-containing protein [Nostoc sp. DedQUE07]